MRRLERFPPTLKNPVVTPFLQIFGKRARRFIPQAFEFRLQPIPSRILFGKPHRDVAIPHIPASTISFFNQRRFSFTALAGNKRLKITVTCVNRRIATLRS
jgi:hypothetical protein